MSRTRNYYVVNAGRGRASTHIMASKSPDIPGALTSFMLMRGKVTLCGLEATRHVDVFSPAKASCRECRERWRRAVQRERNEAAPTTGTGLSTGSATSSSRR